jgi:hypothetical protein
MHPSSVLVDCSSAAAPALVAWRPAHTALLALAGLALALGATEAPAQSSETLAQNGEALARGNEAPAQSGEAADAPEGRVASAADAADLESQPALARWVTSADFSGGTYRWSMSRGAFAFGLGFDTPSRSGNIASTRLDNAGPLVQTLPSLSFGLRSVDPPSSSWLKQLAGGESATGFTRHIGIEWKPAEQQLMFLREGLGVRLTGDDSLTMRLKRGTLGIYMKRKF